MSIQLSPRSKIIESWPYIRECLWHRGYNVSLMPEIIDWNYVNKTLYRNQNRLLLSRQITSESFIPYKVPKKLSYVDVPIIPILEEDYKKNQKEEQQQQINEQELSISQQQNNNNNNNIKTENLLLVFHTEEKIGVKDVRTLLDTMKKKGFRKAMLLCFDAPKSITKFMESRKSDYQIEFHLYKRFGFSLLKHSLVPYHTILTEQQKRYILSVYSVEESLFPKHDQYEIISRYYGLPKGTMILYWRRDGLQELRMYIRVSKEVKCFVA